MAAVDVIIISGSMGAGKTAVLGEASDLLAAGGIPCAAIDLDTLGMVQGPVQAREIEFANLAAVWQNYDRLGITRLLIAAAIESRDDLNRIAAAIPSSVLVVCRLTAPLETMQSRVAMRDPGMLRDTFVARVAELEHIMDAARLEDFVVVNDGRPITEVARELLRRAGWTGA